MELNKFREFENLKFREKFDFKLFNKFLPDIKEEEIKNIENQVKNELLNDNPHHKLIEFKLLDDNGNEIRRLQFSKYEFYIRTLGNQWEIWRCAHSSEWPNLITVCIGELESLPANEHFKLPNEIRSVNYKISE